MCRPFTAASSVGGSGRLTESQAAWGTQELRTERRRRIAMDPLHTAVPLAMCLGSALRVPARTPWFGPAVWATHVGQKYVVPVGTPSAAAWGA